MLNRAASDGHFRRAVRTVRTIDQHVRRGRRGGAHVTFQVAEAAQALAKIGAPAKETGNGGRYADSEERTIDRQLESRYGNQFVDRGQSGWRADASQRATRPILGMQPSPGAPCPGVRH